MRGKNNYFAIRRRAVVSLLPFRIVLVNQVLKIMDEFELPDEVKHPIGKLKARKDI